MPRVKKITIRPYAQPPTLPSDYYEKHTIWDALQNNDRQEAYRQVVALVRHQLGPKLYRELKERLQEKARQIVQPQYPLLQSVPQQYHQFWQHLLVCQHVCLPLDRGYSWEGDTVVKGTQGQTLWQVGLYAFGERVQQEDLYREWLQALLQDWAAEGASEQRDSMQQVWYMWQDLGQLSSLTLQQDLEAYWNKCEAWNNDAVAFLQFAYDKHQHVFVWQPWLPSGWLWSIVEQCLVQPHLNEEYLLNPQHLHPLLRAAVWQRSCWAPAQQLWMLAGRLKGGQAAVATSFVQFVRQEGLQLVADKRKEVVVVELLKFRECLTALIQSLPKGSETIQLKSAWEEVVNQDEAIAELLAKHLDLILKSNKKLDEQQSASDQWLNRIISGLFVPLQAKDVFEAFYKKDLAKRLLWSRVVSIDIEKQVCSLLKAECGAAYTSKMEGMFQDIDWSRDSMMLYKQSVSAGEELAPSPAVDVEVQVLTTGYWPVYPQYPNLVLPEPLKDHQDRFSNYYKTKHQGRRMAWQYALGHCVVKCSGFTKTYELIVSLCQALVLIQFETSEAKLTLPTLMQAVGLEDRDEMERILQSLALGKDGTRILRKIDYDVEPGKKKKVRMNVDDRDEFEISSTFTSNQRRIRINNIMMKESKEERDKTVEAVSRDRLYSIDAVIVRIMKARKSIPHQMLIPQVLEQLKFPAQPADVKKRIESLIEREYMERDANDRSRYNYLA